METAGPQRTGGDSPATALRRAARTIVSVELRGGLMTESRAEHPPPAPPKKRCDDPVEPYTKYRVAVSVAAKRSELYNAEKEKLDERYKKLDGAQKQFEDKWNAQKEPWDNLKCKLERILKALYGVTDEEQRKRLRDCWCKIKEPDEDPNQIDCTKLNCDDPECKDQLPDIGDLKRWETQAEDCVKRYDKEFDELAKFPDDIEKKISDLAEQATKLEDAMAAAGSDPLRNYVAYLALEWAFHELWYDLNMSAAEYGCKLKNAFVDLLKAHRKLICFQVAIHKWTEQKKYADAEKGGSIVDRVLEECPPPPTPTKPTEPAKPCKWEAECPKPKPSEPNKPSKQNDYDDKEEPSGGEGPGQDPAGAAC
jgi:hypothetical protein